MLIETMWSVSPKSSAILTFLFPVILCSQFSTSRGSFASVDHRSPLESKLATKLSVGTQIRDNLENILNELPLASYELHRSARMIHDYLKNGGSMLDCIDVIPNLAYLPFEEQLDGILKSTEDNLPRHLIPAISVLRRALSPSNGTIDLTEIFRPGFGPLRMDLLEKISARQLKEATLPLLHEKLFVAQGPWPRLVGQTTALMSHKVIPVRPLLAARILTNLRTPDAAPEVRATVRAVAKFLEDLKVPQLEGAKLSFDPYEFARSVISDISTNYGNAPSADHVLAYFKTPEECQKSSQLDLPFQDNEVHYGKLVSQDGKMLPPTFARTTLFMVPRDLREIEKNFRPFEHANREDLLLALVGAFRRHFARRVNGTADATDEAYGALLRRRSDRTGRRWGILRNAGITRALLVSMMEEEASATMRRLLRDVASGVESVEPVLWKKAQVFKSPMRGPTEATMKTLQALLDVGAARGSLKENIRALLSRHRERIRTYESDCLEALKKDFVDVTTAVANDSRLRNCRDVDVNDLLQALPGLDVYSEEYKTISEYLLREDFRDKVGASIDVSKHPTRARLMARMLQEIDNSDYVDDSVRSLARALMDTIAYEGYGAGRVVCRSSS